MTPNAARLPAVEEGNPLEDRYDLLEGHVHLSGIQALVRLPMDQRRLDQRRGRDTGVFISGYEGSPLAGLDLQLATQRSRLDQHRVVFKPAVNEELAANAVQGSQIASASEHRVGDGVVGIWYGKAPGLDRATDAIRHSNLGGTDRDGGVLALVGDDSIAKSSTVPSSSEPAIAELGMPCLSPADPQDILEMGLHGVAMSRASGLWVAMKLATNVVDGSASVHLSQIEPIEPDLTFDGQPFRHEVTGKLLQPTLGQLEATQVRQRMEIARRYAAANHLDRIIGDAEATVGIVAAGATYLDVRQALADMGLTDQVLPSSGVRVLKLAMINPLEPGIVARFAEGLTTIVVVEEKRAFIELAMKDLLYGAPHAPAIVGKRDLEGHELFRGDADLPADYLAAHLASIVQQHTSAPCVASWIDAQSRRRRLPTLLPILPRSPYFCSGCPHNSSTQVPEGATVGAGIGCHGMITFFPEERVGSSIGLTQMGGEGVPWIGMAPFVKTDHLFQNLGDGTYHHSGSLAVRASVAAGSKITYKLLYNDTVAMTGGQDAVGKMGVPAVVAELLAEGVRRIVVTSDDPRSARRAFGRWRLPSGVEVRHRDDLIPVQEELATVDGVTVLIHQQECATELRRKRKRGLIQTPAQRILINERVCEGCGDCGDKSNCLSVQPIETEFGRKTQIHQASCNLDFSCVKGDCPSFVEVVPAKERQNSKPLSRRRRSRRAAGQTSGVDTALASIEADDLPAPILLVDPSDFSMRITGVGGTGVVTVAQVLAAAAAHAGLKVKGLDQLGLAQKGGAVVSDIRMSTEEIVGANKIGTGGCDLYLGCDVLVAAAETNLAVLSADRSHVIVSTSVTPTGKMVTDIHTQFPEIQNLVDRIQWAGAGAADVFVDARAAVSDALGDDQFANIFLLGAAVQAGALPLSPKDIEWALDLNGVQVQRNLRAFRLGRQHVVDVATDISPVAKSAGTGGRESNHVASIVQAPVGSALREIIDIRVPELVAYQNRAYARRYVEAVEQVRTAEVRALDHPVGIVEEYARQLFKVMAYKDEYEVARLHIDPALEKQIEDQFGRGSRYSILLHPPMLRAIGLKRKLRLKSWWAKPVLKLLYAMRGVRGTRLDIFGYDDVRRAERDLIVDYRESVERALNRLDSGTAEDVLALVALPEWIRGYEHIKLRSLEAYRSQRADLLARLDATVPAIRRTGRRDSR